MDWKLKCFVFKNCKIFKDQFDIEIKSTLIISIAASITGN